jgi:hypothetical protein
LRLRYSGYTLVDSAFSIVDDLVVDSRGIYGVALDHPSFTRLLDFTNGLSSESLLCNNDVMIQASLLSFYYGDREEERSHRQMVAFWMRTFQSCLGSYFCENGLSAFYRGVRTSSDMRTSSDSSVAIVLGPFCYGVVSDLSEGSSLFCTSPLRRAIDFMNLSLLYWRLVGSGVRESVLASWVSGLERVNWLSRKVAKMTSQLSLLSVVASSSFLESSGIVSEWDPDSCRGVVWFVRYRFSAFFKYRGADFDIVTGKEYMFRLYYFASELVVRKKVRV